MLNIKIIEQIVSDKSDRNGPVIRKKGIKTVNISGNL